jgi:benzoate/toluate 1,2-dioxygenase subunit beta
MSGAEVEAARELVWREAAALDERRWDDWLALYDEAAVFWVPAWKNEDTPTADPDAEISLIYIASRAQLEERVSRVRSGRSAASSPMPRTAHALSNLLVEPSAGGAFLVRSVATTHLFDLRRRESHLYYSRCEHLLAPGAGGLRIRRKKVLVLNDYLPTAVDFYTV